MSNASGIFIQLFHDEARAYCHCYLNADSEMARLNTLTDVNLSLDVTGGMPAMIHQRAAGSWRVSV